MVYQINKSSLLFNVFWIPGLIGLWAKLLNGDWYNKETVWQTERLQHNGNTLRGKLLILAAEWLSQRGKYLKKFGRKLGIISWLKTFIFVFHR